MPSPFPGMDPYLEGEWWQEFHETLASAIRARLMPQLAPKYVALLAKRYLLDRPALGVFDAPHGRVVYPDVHVVAPAETLTTVVPVGGGRVTAPAVELPSFLEVPQLTVEIRDVAQRRLIAVLEILSPANKDRDGAREYRDRRTDLLRTRVHLLEIDLLRGGARIGLVGEPPAAPYYVYLSRWQRRPFTQIWPIALRDPLPTVPVPLLPDDPDATLDLQAAVADCFALVGYERLLPYDQPPPPPELPSVEEGWVMTTARRGA